MSYNPFSSIGTATHPIQLQNVAGQTCAQSQAQAIQQLQQYAQQSRERSRWKIDGVEMTFKEFADTLFPEPTAERTMFYLRYSKDEDV